ncbi:MAG: hypothetical protein RRY34_04455, partial [Victivallaceae bacterium]
MKTAKSQTVKNNNSRIKCNSDGKKLNAESMTAGNSEFFFAADKITLPPLPADYPKQSVTYQVANMPLAGDDLLSVTSPETAGATTFKSSQRVIGPEIGPDPINSSCSVRFEESPHEVVGNGIRYDFAFGYRLMTPPGDAGYQVRIYDLDSGMPLEQYELKGGQLLVGNRKFFVRYRLEVWREEALIFEHNYDCRGKRIYIVIPDGGLGDNLAWLPYAEKFRLEN